MNSFNIEFFLKRKGKITIDLLIFVFLLNPLHWIIYISSFFDCTPLFTYEVTPNLKTKAYKRDSNFSLPIILTDDTKKSLPNSFDMIENDYSLFVISF